MSLPPVLYIRNMVCHRCILAVQSILERLGLVAQKVELGTVELKAPPTADQLEALRQALLTVGFELIDDRRLRTFERIRNAVIRLARSEGEAARIKLSDYLQEACHQEYSALSKLFSEIKGVSIEKYYIAQRIERVKELLVYDELTLSQIADRMNYSSTAHLSAQFKNVTGLSPRQFKQSQAVRRLPLDEV